MEKTLYLDCSSGISGDMAVAALLDLGVDFSVLQDALKSMNIDGFQIKKSRVMKAGIDCMDFAVILDEDNHDHDMEYLHGHEHMHDHEHTHDREHTYGHEHTHDHEHTHPHVHRGLKEINAIIDNCSITENARRLAKKIFAMIANAEAKAHAKSIDEVHFHEVGAVDSIVDIISFAVCFDNLGIERVIIPNIVEGTGTVRCAHGILPIPVPAVANIVAASGLNIEISKVKGELITPTGAAIAAAIITDHRLPGGMKIKNIGIGAGKRNYERPSMLRAMLIETTTTEWIYKLETNIDDCTGEALGFVMELLFEAGAKDVHYTPVYMKKNRPGWQLNVICEEKDIEKLEHIIFDNTTTIGIRRMRCERTVLDREFAVIKTKYGNIKVKICADSHGKRYYPEYDSVVKICRDKNLSYQQAYAAAVAACYEIK